jgi:hypothetical protein
MYLDYKRFIKAAALSTLCAVACAQDLIEAWRASLAAHRLTWDNAKYTLQAGAEPVAKNTIQELEP